MATYNFVYTGPLAIKLDAFLRDILNLTVGFDIFEPAPEGTYSPNQFYWGTSRTQDKKIRPGVPSI